MTLKLVSVIASIFKSKLVLLRTLRDIGYKYNVNIPKSLIPDIAFWRLNTDASDIRIFFSTSASDSCLMLDCVRVINFRIIIIIINYPTL